MTTAEQKTLKKVKKAVKPEAIEIEDAAREAYAPVATAIDETAFVVRACDGDDEYVYIVAKEGRHFVVAEVYPGLRKRETNVRKASRPIDLVFDKNYKTIEAVVKEIHDVIFEGLEDEDQPTATTKKAAPKTANDQQTPQLAAVG